MTGSAVSLATTSGTASNILSMTLTAGDWDVWGSAQVQNTTAVTQWYVWVSTTSATAPADNYGQASSGIGGGMPYNITSWVATPPRRVLVTASTTVYLEGAAYFASAQNPTAIGSLYARRAR
jgi:hypothetical protein